MRTLLYLGGGIAAGWAIGKLLFDDGPIRSNASKKRRPKKRKSAAGERTIRSQVEFGPDDPIKPLKVAIPEYAEDTTLWSTLEDDRFVVMQDEVLPIGFVEKQKDKYEGFVLVDEKLAPVISKTTRKTAIGAVYVADLLLKHLRLRRGHVDNAGDIAEELGVPLSLVVKAGQALARGITEERDEAGKKKRTPFIFGITSKVRIDPTLQEEKVVVPFAPPRTDDPMLQERQRKEKKRAQRRRRQGRKKAIAHKRRMIVGGKQDVAKLRKSQVLTPEEKKALPKAKVVQRYAFGSSGPRGVVGMYGFGPESPQQEWSDEELKRFEKRLEQKALEQAAAAKAEAEVLAEQAAATALLPVDRPYYTSLEETIWKLLKDPEEEPSDAFFEDKRLEGLDWLSRQRDEQYRARKIAAAMKRVEKLREALAKATERREAAEAAGDSEWMKQAVLQQMKLRSELGAALERLARVQPPQEDE